MCLLYQDSRLYPKPSTHNTVDTPFLSGKELSQGMPKSVTENVTLNANGGVLTSFIKSKPDR